MIRTMKLLFLLLFASARFEVEVEVEVAKHSSISSVVATARACMNRGGGCIVV